MAAGAVAVPQIIALNYGPGAYSASGRRSNGIDSGTKIEISTDTQGALIYFTIDGSRPGESSRSTRKYKHAFSLPPGKYTIRAVAVTADGRESAIASKSITVAGVNGTMVEGRNFRGANSETPRSDGINFVDDMSTARSHKHQPTRHSSKEAFAHNLHNAWTEEQQSQRHSNAAFSSTHLDERTKAQLMKESIQQHHPPRMPPPPQEVTHLYTCARCGLRLPPGAARCVVCECESILVTALPGNPQSPAQSAVPTQLVPSTPWQIQTCLVCGVSNPQGVARCFSCAAVLPADTRPGFVGTTAPPMPTMQSQATPTLQNTITHTRCPACSRLNDVRARFCDWCAGRLPGPATHAVPQLSQQVSILCSKCGSPLLSANRPCFSCGTFAVPPSRDSNYPKRMDESFLNQTAPSQMVSNFPPADPFTRSATADNFVLKLNKSCQTVQTGAYVPTGMAEETPRRGLPISNLSPGRGYWRQQLKHISAQLEAFASTSADFRAAIGPHQMGRLLAARVTNSGGDEFVLRLVFNLPKQHNERSYLRSQDTLRKPNSGPSTLGYYDRHQQYDRGSLLSGRSGIDAYSKYEPKTRRPGSDLSSSKRNASTTLGRRAYGSSKYADLDDYVPSDRQIDRLNIEEHTSSAFEDASDLVTATSDDDTSDHDILDTFREDQHPRGHNLYYGTKRRTNQRFVVSSTPRRAGRKVAGAVVSRSLTTKQRGPVRPVTAVDEAMANKPSMLALKELGVDGAGRVSELARLFSEMDVDPATKSRDGWSLAHLAVINRHPDAIPVIAQYAKAGNEDAISGRGPSNAFGNTPLHEAVRLSTSSASAVKALDALLTCGADVAKRNDRGETPFEYAQRLGHADAGKKIAAAMGKRRLEAAGLLNDSSKSRQHETVNLSD